jgi:hypothetical protein
MLSGHFVDSLHRIADRAQGVLAKRRLAEIQSDLPPHYPRGRIYRLLESDAQIRILTRCP